MDEIAIIGMACIFPGAPDLKVYWNNIISKVNAISVPPKEWEAIRYFDPHSDETDRIYCKKGGYLGDLARFDPFEYGIMPTALDGGEPDHFLALRVANQALEDAGYSKDSINSERTEVILGRGTYINRGITNLFQHGVVLDQTIDILKELHPEYTETELLEIKSRLGESLPPFNADTAPTLVPNVLTGRIANRLNLMGANYIVDAACASSLVAVEHGMRDLIIKKCDLALVGGVNASIPPPILMIFCQINALSRKQELRPFDEGADGTMLGEGLGVIILKRKADAKRDGDRIYAVLKAVGLASDGRGLGLLAPRMEGQALAIKRAYETANISPQSVGLIEAHGTGIPLGDVTEIRSLQSVFGPRLGLRPSCALGSVKSMISHLIPAAGIAGLIKAALALYHKVLPPTLNCDKPNPNLELEKTPFYLNTETRPWIHGDNAVPRRAGVNAFGFGGINAHAILEEYVIDTGSGVVYLHQDWETEVFLIQGKSRSHLIEELHQVKNFVEARAEVVPKDLAYTLNSCQGTSAYRLAIVSGSREDLMRKLAHAAVRLADPSCQRIRERSGIYFFEKPLGIEGKLAFLFPGEGSQYPNMLSDLCLHFPEVRDSFDLADQVFIGKHRQYLPSHSIFPLPLDQDKDTARLWAMDSAAEAVFVANQALLKLMERLELRPDVLLGHSTGEYSALLASGMLEIEDDKELIAFVRGVNSLYEKLNKQGQIAGGILLTVGSSDRDLLKSIVEKSTQPLYIAMDNCFHQVVLCGQEQAITQAEKVLKSGGVICDRLPFNRAYHTSLFKPFCASLHDYFARLKIRAPQIETYSCATAQPFPNDPDEIRDLATSQWARRVRFRETIEAMYGAGVRIFVEVGPRGNLTAFVEDILQKKPHVAVAANLHRRSSITQLNHLVGQLSAHHVTLNPAVLYEHRGLRELSLRLSDETSSDAKSDGRSLKINLVLPRLTLRDASPKLERKAKKESDNAAWEPTEIPQPILTQQPATSLPVNSRFQAMSEYFNNMERFLEVQQEIMQTYLQKNVGVNASIMQTLWARIQNLDEPPQAGVGLVNLPFVDEIISHTPGQQVIALCRLNLAKDKFLRDHTLGGTVSAVDQELTALPVVPLTFSMELLAEAASLLVDGKKLIGMRNIRAFRWIALEEESKLLQIVATLKSAATRVEVEVQIREIGQNRAEEITPGLAIIEGTMIFDDDYPQAPPLEPFSLISARPSKWCGTELYSGFMFHGPSLQSVESMELWGENGAQGTLRAMPDQELLSSSSSPQFLADPVTLDGAGQVIAYWTSDHLTKAFHIFPFRLDNMWMYGPGFSPPERASCYARIQLVNETQVCSDIDIIGPDGQLRYRLCGWWDRRFNLPERFFQLRSSPRDGMLSIPWDRPIQNLPERELFQCCLVNAVSEEFLSAHDRIWERVLAHLVLSRRERLEWKNFSKGNKRRLDWLLGRIAVKDAVRLLFNKRAGIQLYPADLEIVNDEHGRPAVKCLLGEQTPPLPSISVAHKSCVAVAIAGQLKDGYGMGIDIELNRMLADGFDRVALAPGERDLLASLCNLEYAEWLLRVWCAKETIGKALGRGLPKGPGNLILRHCEAESGVVDLEVAGILAREFPELSGKMLRAHTFRDGELVGASALLILSNKDGK